MERDRNDAHALVAGGQEVRAPDLLTGVGQVRRKPGQGVVAPVVHEAAIAKKRLRSKGMYRQQLDGRDAEGSQVVDDGVTAEAGQHPPVTLGHRGVTLREALQVHLVDDRVRPGRTGTGSRRLRQGHDASLGHEGCAVAAIGRLVIRTHAIAIQGRRLAELAMERPRIGIQQQLGRIETVAKARGIGAVDPITVQQTFAGPGQEPVPHVAAPLRQEPPALLLGA